jgi:superfamily II DNA or RNA helicase
MTNVEHHLDDVEQERAPPLALFDELIVKPPVIQDQRQLWEHQQRYIDAIMACPHRRILVVLPTGGGKTTIAATIIKQYGRETKPGIFIVHLREIVQQASDRLKEEGIAHGIIMAGEPYQPQQRVQTCSIQTLHPRLFRRGMEKPDAAVIFVDEAHRVNARTYQEILDEYPDAKIIGLTATPCRGDGNGLGGTFETMIDLVQVQELIDKGILVKTKVYAALTADLKGVKIDQGD